MITSKVLYRVYYMDNDAQKIFVDTDLSYEKAVQIAQEMYTTYELNCRYEVQPDNVKYITLASRIYNHY